MSRSDKGQSSSVFSSCSSTQHPVILTGEHQVLSDTNTSPVSQDKVTTSGWSSSQGAVPCPRGSSSACSQSRVSRGKWQGISDNSLPEELGYLVDAIINTGDITSFDSDKGTGNLSQEDKILLSRYDNVIKKCSKPCYQAAASPQPVISDSASSAQRCHPIKYKVDFFHSEI